MNSQTFFSKLYTQSDEPKSNRILTQFDRVRMNVFNYHNSDNNLIEDECKNFPNAIQPSGVTNYGETIYYFMNKNM